MIKHNITIPIAVSSRLLALGTEGEMWLKNLPILLNKLEQKWSFTTTDILSGGSHAFIGKATLENAEKAIIKISTPHKPDDGDLPFINEIAFINANPEAFVKLFNVDEKSQSCLMELCGKPLKDLNFSTRKQLDITCRTLQKVWIKPTAEVRQIALDTKGVCSLLQHLLTDLYKTFPIVSQNTMNKTFAALASRASQVSPKDEVMTHGDAHPANILQSLTDPNEFKLIDPDGIISEPAYDMGILMREWTDELIKSPVKAGEKRALYLSQITGIDKQAIWEWGLIQSTASALLCAKVGQNETSATLGKIATSWADYVIKDSPDFLKNYFAPALLAR